MECDDRPTRNVDGMSIEEATISNMWEIAPKCSLHSPLKTK